MSLTNAFFGKITDATKRKKSYSNKIYKHIDGYFITNIFYSKWKE